MHPEQRFIEEQAPALGPEIHDGPLAFKPGAGAVFPDLREAVVLCKEADGHAFIRRLSTYDNSDEPE